MKEDARETTLTRDLTEGHVLKTLLVFSFPLMCSNLLQTLYNMVDMVVIGQFVGKDGLSAVSIGGDVLHLLTFLVIGFSNAGQVILAQFVGEGNRGRVQSTVGTLFTVIAASAVAISLLSFFGLDWLLQCLNTPPGAMDFARDYGMTCIAGLVFIYGYNMVSAVLRGMGDSRHPFLFVAVATVINVVLDLLFVGVLDLRAFGAALATVIGQAVSFLWAVVFLYRNRQAFGFDFRRERFVPDPQILKKLLRLGLPMCLQSVAINISMLFVNAYINAYGVVASAVTGIGNKLSSVTSIVTIALSTAGSSMVGQCIGARKYERVSRIMVMNGVIGFGFAGLLSFVTVCFPRELFGLFNREEAVLEMAMVYIPVAVLMYGGYAMRSPFFSLINGSGNGRVNLAVALLDGVVCRIGLAILLGLWAHMGIMGFWLGNALSGYVPGLIGTVFYRRGSWRKPRET